MYSNLTPMGVQKRNVDKTIAAQKELAEYQYGKDLDMWHRANEYNSPESQMGRLKAAGLNPNLVYGSGSAAGNTASQLPRYSAPSVSYQYAAPRLGAVLSMYQDIAMRDAQIQNVRAQTSSLERFRNPLMQAQASLTGTKDWHEATKAGTSYIQQEHIKQLFPYQLGAARENERRLSLTNEGIQADNLFKKFRNEWMAAGVTSADNPLLRMIIRSVNQPQSPFSKLMQMRWTDKMD